MLGRQNLNDHENPNDYNRDEVAVGCWVEDYMADAICAVCGKEISKNESRYVDVQAGTKVQVHTACKK